MRCVLQLRIEIGNQLILRRAYLLITITHVIFNSINKNIFRFQLN